MKLVIACLNSKYIHASLAPWCLLSGVRAYSALPIEAKVMESTINSDINTFAEQIINENPDIKFVVAPHEMEESRINRFMQRVKGGAVRYTACGTEVKADAQVLILDVVGILASVYKYADWAYIGGGFGAGIHYTLEAATFGVPIAFGLRYKKFKEAVDMVALGAACSVADAEALKGWFNPLRDDAEHLAEVGNMARDYTLKNCGATDKITKSIFG